MKKIKALKIFSAITLTHVCAVITAVFGIILLAFMTACVLRFLPVGNI